MPSGPLWGDSGSVLLVYIFAAEDTRVVQRSREGPGEGWNDGGDPRLSFGVRGDFFGPGITKRELCKVRATIYGNDFQIYSVSMAPWPWLPAFHGHLLRQAKNQHMLGVCIAHSSPISASEPRDRARESTREQTKRFLALQEPRTSLLCIVRVHNILSAIQW